MTELERWPYPPLPSAFDETYGVMRYVIQTTEDGFYGFAFRRQEAIIQMLGPCPTKAICQQRLLEALTGGAMGV